MPKTQDLSSEWDLWDAPPAPTALCVFYFAAAFLATSLPVYLYATMFSMGTEHKGLFAIVTLSSAVILMFAYHNVAYWVERRLAEKRDASLKKKSKDMDRLMRDRFKQGEERRDAQQSIAFSIMCNNAFFLFGVCAIGFYIAAGCSAPFNYVVAVGGSAALCFYQSIQEIQQL